MRLQCTCTETKHSCCTIVYFEIPGPLVFGRKIKRLTQFLRSIHFWKGYNVAIFLMCEWRKYLEKWKSDGTFCKKLWFAIVLTFPVYARPRKPSCSLHRSFWNSSGRGSSPKNICNLNPPSLWRSSSETEAMTSLLCAVNLPAISSSTTSFGVKTRERSKYWFVDITWHRRSIARSFVDNKLSNFGRKCPKKCLPRFKNGAFKLRLCHFVNEGPGILKIDYSSCHVEVHVEFYNSVVSKLIFLAMG